MPTLAFSKLHEILSVLASSSADQRDWLAKRHQGQQHSADELALELNDTYLILWQALDAGEITEQDATRVKAIADLFGRISGIENEDLWAIEALDRAAEWQQVRDLARQCLINLVPLEIIDSGYKRVFSFLRKYVSRPRWGNLDF